MTNYNVVEDRADWARVKVSLMTPEDRKHLVKALIKSDERYAIDIMTELIANGHSMRVSARRRVDYP